MKTVQHVNAPSSSRSVLIIEDHELIRRAIRRIVETDLGWTVCGEAGDGRTGVELGLSLKPDIIVLDLGLPGLNGLDAARQLKKRVPKLEILVFSGNDARETVLRAFDVGVRSFLPKTELSEHLLAALVALGKHKPYFTPSIERIVFDRFLRKVDGEKLSEENDEQLTEREREVVQLAAEGQSSKEIATTLGVSVKTVESHRAVIMRKLRLKSVAQLVRYAVRSGLIQA